jgi:hypothetical protein
MGLGESIGKLFGHHDEAEDTPPAEVAAVSPDVAEMAAADEGGMLGAVQGAMGGLEKLVSKIPGYRGYKEKEQRREADKLLRNRVAGELDDQRRRLSELQVQIVSSGQIEYADDLERAIMKLQLLIDRVRTSSYGYAGLFDAIKVKEAQLAAIYQFDAKLLDLDDEIAAQVDAITSALAAKEGAGAAIAELTNLVEEANQTFGHRHEAMMQAAEL